MEKKYSERFARTYPSYTGEITMKDNKVTRMMIRFFMVLVLSGVPAPMVNAEDIKLSDGQTVYVPIYSHIYSGIKARPFDLAATLSIRNTDPTHSITLVAVTYYDSDGKLLKEYLSEPAKMTALMSTRYIIMEGDKTGGSGANFIVKWKAARKVNPPIIEGVMIGTRSGQGISFVSRGQIIKDE
jgi:hypothetical protein